MYIPSRPADSDRSGHGKSSPKAKPAMMRLRRKQHCRNYRPSQSSKPQSPKMRTSIVTRELDGIRLAWKRTATKLSALVPMTTTNSKSAGCTTIEERYTYPVIALSGSPLQTIIGPST